MPWGTRANPSVNPMTQLAPKATSSLVRTCRWGFLALGIAYGYLRKPMFAQPCREIHEREKVFYEFNDARVRQYWKDKLKEDDISLKREVAGLPPLQFEPLDKPLLLDDVNASNSSKGGDDDLLKNL